MNFVKIDRNTYTGIYVYSMHFFSNPVESSTHSGLYQSDSHAFDDVLRLFRGLPYK